MQMIEREESRWQQIEKSQDAEQAKWNQIRETGDRNRRNVNSVPYNPISLNYNNNQDGDKLRLSDDMVRFRAAHRAKQLRDRDTCGFNPITGESVMQVQVPPKPTLDQYRRNRS